MENEKSLEPRNEPESAVIATLESSHRLTPGISLHIFSLPNRCRLSNLFRPSQHITLQFPQSLDLIYGSRFLKDEDRCLTFTPCCVRTDEDGNRLLISIITKNGRVTGLLGIPRPQGPLSAELMSSGGGFSMYPTDSSGCATCIAGGIGIAPFLAMPGDTWRESGCNKRVSLLWSINGNDFPLVEHLVRTKVLQLSDWNTFGVFITSGGEDDGFAAGKPKSWWDHKMLGLHKEFSSSFEIQYRRVEEGDLKKHMTDGDHKVFYCGSKSLEWQIRMWCLDSCPVYKTDMP